MIKFLSAYLFYSAVLFLTWLLATMFLGEGGQEVNLLVFVAGSVFFFSKLGGGMNINGVARRWGWVFWGRFVLFLFFSLLGILFVAGEVVVLAMLFISLAYSVFPHAKQKQGG